MRSCWLAAALVLSCLALCESGFPGKTNELVTSLSTCSDEISADVACITRLKDGLEDAKTQIEKIRALKIKMKQINDGFNSLNNINGFVKYLPGIGGFVNAINRVLHVVKTPFTRAYNVVKRIDSRVHPYKPKCERGIRRCDQAIEPLEVVQGVCETGESHLTTVRDCVESMSNGTVTTTLESSLELLGGALNPPFDVLLLATGRVGDGCHRMDSFIDAVNRWPDFDRFLRPLNKFHTKLGPVLSFFNRVQSALRRRVCVPLPNFKKLNPRRWGRRRRSTIHSIQKRDLCFSAQSIMDGVDGVIGPLVRKVNKLMNKLIKKIPTPDLPGMPDFDDILDIDLDINMAEVDLKVDTDLFHSFDPLTWDCATQVKDICETGVGTVTADCARNLVADFTQN